MKKLYSLMAGLLLGGNLLVAQALPPVAPTVPCSTFENPNPAGNWVTTACTAQYVDTNPLDGTQCATLYDGSGGSWYQNTTDYNGLGRFYLNNCLCFDYYLVNDGGSGVPFYPTIYLSDGINTIAFVSSTAVTPGSGWIRVCAPIVHCSGSTLPSNASGSWVQVTGSGCVDFNNTLDNVTSVSFPTDITSCPCEVMSIDNVCVTRCTNCQAAFRLAVSFNSDNTSTADVFLDFTDPSSTYDVDWGDGSPVTSPYVSHVYSTPGVYNVCVTQYIQRKVICRVCRTFCYKKSTQDDGGGVVIGDGPNGRSANPSAPLTALRTLADRKFSDEGFMLFPNPSKDYTEVQMNLSKKDQVSVKVIDLLGRVVAETTGTYEFGSQKIKLNTERLTNGVYNVEINVGGNVSVQKLSISK